jgi:hypothetical protein
MLYSVRSRYLITLDLSLVIHFLIILINLLRIFVGGNLNFAGYRVAGYSLGCLNASIPTSQI